jgi:ribonuclease J
VSQVGEVPSGRLVRDGKRLVEIRGDTIRQRRRILENGAALATVAVDRAGALVGRPQIALHGLVEKADAGEVRESLCAAIDSAIAALDRHERRDDDAVKEAARLSLRRTLRALYAKRPVLEVHLVRIDEHLATPERGKITEEVG